MDSRELLFDFEEKCKFLYDIEVNGVPIYAGLRDGVLKCLQYGTQRAKIEFSEMKEKIFFKRIWDGFIKLSRMKRNETLIFTSAIYRRDNGRNLAAEYIWRQYPQAIIFEWPSRRRKFDEAYFRDVNKGKYVPLDYYLVCLKIYMKIHKTEYKKTVELQRKILNRKIVDEKLELSKNEKIAIEYILQELPESYAMTMISQKVFRRLFKNYKNVKNIVDFWGGARENIIPIFKENVQAIELQHGIITEVHQGYMYPPFANRVCKRFFERKILVYGEKTKKLLIEKSIFQEEQIEVIGNPRIKLYNEEREFTEVKRNIILFTSQPFEQDGAAVEYYETVLPLLKKIQDCISNSVEWKGYKLGVKLHPREEREVGSWYKKNLNKAEVYDSTDELYELLNKTFLHVTVSSTTLFEAALFGSPTILIPFNEYDSKKNYGFFVYTIKNIEEIPRLLLEFHDKEKYDTYLNMLLKSTIQYM